MFDRLLVALGLPIGIFIIVGAFTDFRDAEITIVGSIAVSALILTLFGD